MNILQIYEHQVLRYEHGLHGYHPLFQARHYQAMVAFHDQQGRSIYYSLVRSGVKFTQYVGVLQVEDLTIEVLPKTDQSEAQPVWRDVLWRMLRETRFLQLDQLSEAALRYRQHSILHAYLAQYLTELGQLLRSGLIKKYRQTEGNTHALKGRILFARHLSQNVVHQERFYTRHQTYDRQHLIHQLLYEALLAVERTVGSSALSGQASGLRGKFPEQMRVQRPVTRELFDQLRPDRKTAPYHKALEIARMILLNDAPDIRGGSQQLLALLFDMNELWEEYLYRQLLKAGLDVRFQESGAFWETKKMRPDMVVRSGDEVIILDAKWKMLTHPEPSDEDLRQVFVYNTFWGATRGFLIYPKTRHSPASRAGRYQNSTPGGLPIICEVVFVDVFEDGDYLPVGRQLRRFLGV